MTLNTHRWSHAKAPCCIQMSESCYWLICLYMWPYQLMGKGIPWHAHFSPLPDSWPEAGSLPMLMAAFSAFLRSGGGSVKAAVDVTHALPFAPSPTLSATQNAETMKVSLQSILVKPFEESKRRNRATLYWCRRQLCTWSSLLCCLSLGRNNEEMGKSLRLPRKGI